MLLSVADFLNDNWIIVLLVILLLAIIIIVIIFLYYKFVIKENSFKENFTSSKLLQMEIVINLEEENVQKFYLYDQDHKDEIISLNEFFMHFDQANYEKFKTWLQEIAHNDLTKATFRNEIVMYDTTNTRSVYLVELENYDVNRKIYFLKFQDITKSKKINLRLNKNVIEKADANFFNQVNQRLSVVDNNAKSYLVAITYKEYKFAQKELMGDFLESLHENIYQKIAKMKFDNELLCLKSDNVFLLFSPNVANNKKYISHIKKILSANSGTYSLANNSFTYNINLIAGYTIVKSENINVNIITEAENALKALETKAHINEKLKLYDESLEKLYNSEKNKEVQVTNIILQDSFDLSFSPIINTVNKEIAGYSMDIILNNSSSDNLTIEEFKDLVVKTSQVVQLYTKIFEKILLEKSNDVIYFIFDLQIMNDVLLAYDSNKTFKKLNIYFCIEFSPAVIQKTDMISIEKAMANAKKNYDIRFGIYYNTLASTYLNEKIYLKADIVVIGGQLVEQSLDKYGNKSLIEHYSNLAEHYHHELISLNVNSLAIYELLNHFNIKKIGGSVFKEHVSGNKILDKSLLKSLKEIENRNY